MPIPVSERLDPLVIQNIQKEISKCDGNEVLVVGKLNSEGVVGQIVFAARGNEHAVPALDPYMEKGDVVIHNHPKGRLAPSDADLSIAARLGNGGIGFYIIDNCVEYLYVVAEPVRKKETRFLDVEKLAELIDSGGKLCSIIEGFEPRASQIEMLKEVCKGFNTDSIYSIEAGTGVGKSFAYLIPAFVWAEINDERVLISTATINLQQQLIEKDIPVVKRLLGSKVKSVLVKGRANYLCMRRLSETEDDVSLFGPAQEQIHALRTWAESSATGSKSDLPFVPDDDVWNSVCSESDTCMGLRCTHREVCFVLKAKREAASAQVLIANHHLLFSDLSMRISGAGFESTAVLPPFQRIIFDEAHNIEKNATSYFSDSFNKYTINKQLFRLFRKKRGRNSGLLTALERRFGDDKDFKAMRKITGAVKDEAELLTISAQELLGEQQNLRYSKALSQGAGAKIIESMRKLQTLTLDLIEICENRFSTLSDADYELPEVFETRIIMRRLEEFAGICERFQRLEEHEDRIFWLEKGRTSRGDLYVTFIITPLDISKLICDAVFEPYNTVICTSATLAVRDSFDFWKRRVGLTGFSLRNIQCRSFPSPFPYEKNVLIGIPSDAPFPDDVEFPVFLESFLGDVLEISEGRALVLFTSFEMLKVAYEHVKTRLNKRGITVFRQGDDDRAKLLKRFQDDVASVLFATDSFWEGVDAPGEALSVVIICRLPFKVPTDPVVSARMEAIEKRNGNAFMEFLIPEAVMKLKQGFGRLMRKSTDRGAVLILDSRLLRKNYGPFFLDSLPKTIRSFKEKKLLLEDVERFLYATQ